MQTGLNGQCPNFVHDYCMLSLKNCFFFIVLEFGNTVWHYRRCTEPEQY